MYKNSIVIGQAVNDSDKTEDIENKTAIEYAATATPEANCHLAPPAGVTAALSAAFAAHLGVALPKSTCRAPKSYPARYKFAPRELANAGRAIVGAEGFSQYKGEVNPEILTMTLYSYVNRIFRLNRTITPQNTVFYQLLNNRLEITETKEISCEDWLQQRDYLKEKVSQHSKAWTIMQDNSGGLWIAVFGKKNTLMVHKMQEFATAPEAA